VGDKAQPAELAGEFERSRGHLRAVAFRMLGSADDADDAVQEAWLRASSADASKVINVAGWLTTIVGRICLDMLRARQRGREELSDMTGFELAAAGGDAARPDDQAIMADSVGLALMVVLDRLGPAERVAFVLHDLFAVPFDEIAGIVDRSPTAAKKLASRARHRVHGVPTAPAADLTRQRRVVDAFLAASRAGDLDAMLAVLAPEVVRRADRTTVLAGVPAEVRGARRVAEQALTAAGLASFSRPALVNGVIGMVVAPRGRLLRVLEFTVDGDRITAINIIGEPARLRRLDLAAVDIASA